MTFRWRLRYWLAWHLLTIADWLCPPMHVYMGVGENVAHNYCQNCGRDYYEPYPCRGHRDQLGYKPRLRPIGRRA